MDTDQQKATPGWLSWLQQPTSRTPRSTASRTFCGSGSGYSQPDPAFRPGNTAGHRPMMPLLPSLAPQGWKQDLRRRRAREVPSSTCASAQRRPVATAGSHRQSSARELTERYALTPRSDGRGSIPSPIWRRNEISLTRRPSENRRSEIIIHSRRATNRMHDQPAVYARAHHQPAHW